MARNYSEETPIWKIALGVALGILVAGVIGFFVRAWMAQQAVQQITEQTNQMLVRQQQAAADARRRVEEQEAARKAEVVRAQQELEASKRAALLEVERREQAWRQFYKRPAKCDNNPNNETLMECANEHIRAKRRFEELYSSGKL